MWIWTVIIVAYLVVGFKRMPVYYKVADNFYKDIWPYSHRDGELEKIIVWTTVWIYAFWPFYELISGLTKVLTWYMVDVLKVKEEKK